MIGKTISHYRITERLGEGGMGVVYKAVDTRLERDVALKFLRTEFVRTEDDRKRFFREARALAALDHANICTVYELDEADGQAFIAMAFVEGQSLRQAVEAGPMLADRALEIVREAARGVQAAHDKGIIHRDIKGGNIMVTPSGNVKILDFGLARLADRSLLTREGTTVGTIAYMAPEQASGGAVDQRTDVWALGVLLYELVAGQLPFRADFDQAIVYRVLNEDPQPLAEWGVVVPDGLQAIVDRALAKKPEDRFQSATELIRAIDLLRGDASPAQSPTPVAEPVRQISENSVAVFDFQSLSGSPDDDWLSVGIAETVTIDLKRVGSLDVVSRADVVKALSGTSPGEIGADRVIELGRGLRVRWVVWGTYQKFGDAIRMTAHFSNTGTGELADSFKVDGSMQDIFRLQDQIVTSLAELLDVELDSGELDMIQREETHEEKAYEYYARGRQMYNEFGVGAFEKVKELYVRAIDLDPDYALAHSGLGSLYLIRFISRTNPADLETGIDYAKKAIALDPDIADPYVWLTYFYGRQKDYNNAVAAGRRAIELEDNNPLAFYFFAVAQVLRPTEEYSFDRVAEGAALLERAVELAPRYQPAVMVLAWQRISHGQYEPAEELLRNAADIEQSGTGWGVKFVGGGTLLGDLLFRLRKLDEARKCFEDSLVLLGSSEHVYQIPFIVLSHCGLADVAFAEGRYDEALKRYGKAVELTESYPERMASGFFHVRARAGMSKSYYYLGVNKEAREQIAAAREVLRAREGFSFDGMMEGCNDRVYFELSAAYAVLQQVDEAIECLGEAVRYGWRDITQVEREAHFRVLEGDPRYEELIDIVRATEPLP